MKPNSSSLKFLLIGTFFICSGTPHLISNAGKQQFQTQIEVREVNGILQKIARQIDVDPNQIPKREISVADQPKLDAFYANCSEPFKKCWGVAYYPDGDDVSCMEKKDCNFAFSVTENEDNFEFSSLRLISANLDGGAYISFGNELLRMYIGYVPLKEGKRFDENIDCDRTPNLEDFKVMAYSREASGSEHPIIEPVINIITWDKTWLQETCKNSIQESDQDETKRLYNIKSYFKYHNLQKFEAFADDEDYYFDLESKIFENPVEGDPNFYRLKEEAEYVNSGIFDELYDRCQYPSKATCYGFWAKGCIEKRDCYFIASIRESTEMFILQTGWTYLPETEEYISGFGRPYKNLGETAISHCRGLVRSDFKVFIYSNLTEDEAPTAPFRTLFTSFIPKNEFIESCLSPDNEEFPNPIPLEHFYRDNTLFKAYKGDYGENFEELEGMFKSKDGVFYTNLEQTDEITTTELPGNTGTTEPNPGTGEPGTSSTKNPGDGNASWNLKANSIFVISIFALSMLMNF